MKLLLIVLLLITANVNADYYERVVTGQSYIIQVDGVTIGKPSANRNLVLGAGYAEAKKCLTCKVRMISADTTIAARLVVTSSSAKSSAASSAQSSAGLTLAWHLPTHRLNGKPFTSDEVGGYELRITRPLSKTIIINIPPQPSNPAAFLLHNPVALGDVVEFSVYDKNKIYSDFANVSLQF